MRKVAPFILGFVGAVVVVSLVLKPWQRRVEQPIAFNHQVHVEGEELPCTGCHEFAEQRQRASIPNTDTCLDCHDDDAVKNPEIGKIHQYVRQNKPIPWVRLNQIPSHVYFSHRRHVSLGQVECTTCHGDMGGQTRPPARPLVSLAMEDCIACHQQKRVDTDCLTCHR